MASYIDFIGFSFNGVHSSDLGILHVSDGSRYTEDLTAAFELKTTKIPGGDGTYFFSSNYTQRQFSLNIAFDDVSEMQLRRMRQVFNAKAHGPLIFDEWPFKYYNAYVASAPQIKYVCFNKKDAQGHISRVYKGEGTINLVSYYPYAHSVHKYLNLYDNANKNEWAQMSYMLESGTGYDTFNTTTGEMKVYNAGDVEAPLKIFVPLTSQGYSKLWITIEQTQNTIGSLGSGALASITLDRTEVMGEKKEFKIESVEKQGDDTYMCINSKTHLIEGGNIVNGAWISSGNLYNKYIVAGDFFGIPAYTPGGSTYKIRCTDTGNNSIHPAITVEYNYLYY